MINKKMILSILVIAFVGITAAGTWAEWTADASATDSQVVAGTMNLLISTDDGVTFTETPVATGFSAPLVKPGDSGTLGTIYIKNGGSVDETLNELKIVDESETGTNLYQYLTITANGQTIYEKGTKSTNNPNVILSEDETMPFVIGYSVDSAATNSAQGGVFNFNIAFHADQTPDQTPG